jgi:hypothetical protein
MQPAKATANLIVRSSGATVEAELVVTSSAPLALLEAWNVASDGKLRGDIFAITTATPPSRRLDYTGPSIKRRRPRLEDYIRLELGQTFTSIVRLDKFYAFLEGEHEYVAKYSAYHLLVDRDDFWELTSNEARFVFRR